MQWAIKSLNDVLLQHIQTNGWMDMLLHALLIIVALISHKPVKIGHKWQKKKLVKRNKSPKSLCNYYEYVLESSFKYIANA